MKRVTGIGGILFKLENPQRLFDWCEKHLGILHGAHGQGASFHWRELQATDSTQPGPNSMTARSIVPQTAKYFGASKASFMVNYRVDNLDAPLEDLTRSGKLIPTAKTSTTVASPGSLIQTATALNYGNRQS